MKATFFYSLIISLFLAASLTAETPSVETREAKGYLLGPGDEISAKVLGESQFDFTAIVNENGKIEVPFHDKPLVAMCRTEAQLRQEIIELLKRDLRDPRLNLRTISNSRPPATIYGEVRNPQKIVLMRKATLVEMLAIAGGISEDAGGMVQIFRTQPPMCSETGDDGNWASTSGDPTDVPNRMYSLASVRLGKEEANPVIYPGDVIYVHKASPVYIVGEVMAPQGIHLKEGGLSLSEALAMVSGVRPQAKTNEIKIFRLKSGSKDREVIAANYDLIRQGTQKDIMLEPYDIVSVNKAKDSVLKLVASFVLGTAKTVVTSGATGAGYRILY